MNSSERSMPEIKFDLSGTPPLLDAQGVRKHLADVGRTMLYQLATSGEIDSVSLGMGKKGKRLFVTASIVAWIRRRAAATQRPRLASGLNSGKGGEGR